MSRDRFILYTASLMFAALLWTIPSELAAMREEHRSIVKILQIQCVHDAHSNRERTECLTLRLEE